LLKVKGRYKLLDDSPLFADWYSGEIVIPRGKLLNYVHAGFESVYDGYSGLS